MKKRNRNYSLSFKQKEEEAWHQIIGEQTIADAILDRLVHSAHRIDIKGESMRKL